MTTDNMNTPLRKRRGQRKHRPEQLPLEFGKVEAPRERSERRVTQPARQYPPGPAGKVLIFRRYRHDPRTGRIVYAPPGKVFPMWVDAARSDGS